MSLHLTYVLCVWGPSLTQQRFQRLQRLHAKLCLHVLALGNLKVFSGNIIPTAMAELIQYQCCTVISIPSRVMHCISLNPPIQFGHHHNYEVINNCICPSRAVLLDKVSEILSWKRNCYLYHCACEFLLGSHFKNFL